MEIAPGNHTLSEGGLYGDASLSPISIINLAFGIFLVLLNTVAVLQCVRQQRQLTELCGGINTVLAVRYYHERQIAFKPATIKRSPSSSTTPISSFSRLSQGMGSPPTPTIPVAAVWPRKLPLAPAPVAFRTQMCSQGYSTGTRPLQRALSNPLIANQGSQTSLRRHMST